MRDVATTMKDADANDPRVHLYTLRGERLRAMWAPQVPEGVGGNGGGRGRREQVEQMRRNSSPFTVPLLACSMQGDGVGARRVKTETEGGERQERGQGSLASTEHEV
eukprot:1195640-Prorocentrum_minimum.AAC.3